MKRISFLVYYERDKYINIQIKQMDKIKQMNELMIK